MSEYLTGNEAFIDKVVAKDYSIAKKFVTKIQNLSKTWIRQSTPECVGPLTQRVSLNFIRKSHQEQYVFLESECKSTGAMLVSSIGTAKNSSK